MRKPNLRNALELGLAVALPLAFLLYWNLHSRFFVVYDDGEYWHQAFILLRGLQRGQLTWWDVYNFGIGRPTVHYMYGLAVAGVTGFGVRACTQLIMGFFFCMLCAGSFLTMRRATGSALWSGLVTLWIGVEGNFFFAATVFLSELPMFAYFVWFLYFFQRSEHFEHSGWTATAGAALGMIMASRPVEGTILVLMVLTLGTAWFKYTGKLRLSWFLPAAGALALTGALLAIFFKPFVFPQSTVTYFVPLFWAALLPLSFLWKGARRNLCLASGAAGTIFFTWITPHFLQISYWLQAGLYTDKMSAGHVVDAASVLQAAGLVYKVANEIAGPGLTLLALLLVPVLVYYRRVSAAAAVACALICFVGAVFPAGFGKNPSTLEAIDRYYLSEVLALHLGVGIGVWALPRGALRIISACAVVLLAALNVALYADFSVFRSNKLYQLTEAHPWAFRQMVRVQLREESHFAVKMVDDLAALMEDPKKPSKVYLVSGRDIAHRFVSLRGLELDHGWDLRSAFDTDPFQKRYMDRYPGRFYDYVLTGPMEDGGNSREVADNIEKLEHGTKLGRLTLMLSERTISLNLYKVR